MAAGAKGGTWISAQHGYKDAIASPSLPIMNSSGSNRFQ